MNPLDYASLKASKRLVGADIVLETEASWRIQGKSNYYLSPYPVALSGDIPAPSMAEVVRELLTKLGKSKYIRFGLQDNGFFADIAMSDCKESVRENITDALIDLLIWVRNQTLNKEINNEAHKALMGWTEKARRMK